MKKGIIKSFEDFELHHKILSFIVIMSITVLIIRIGVLIYNPNPVIGGFELHHFDYGMILLFITTLLLLFGKKRELLYIILAGISFGMILDELWFIRTDLAKTGNQILIYSSTLPAVLIILMTIIFIVLIINYFKKRKTSKNLFPQPKI